MKTLYVLRHGKSSWATPGQPDLDRPLTGRGERAARAMGAECARRGWRPDAILCSPAVRTRATLARFAAGWAEAGGPPLPAASVDRALYLAEADTWLEQVSILPDTADAALLIGHNPGLHELAAALAGAGDADLRDRLGQGFPTCALAVLAFAGDGWAGVRARAGRLEHLLLPKKLRRVTPPA